MPKTSADYEKEFLDTLTEKTGVDLTTWMGRIEASSLTKNPEIIKWIKADYGLNHLQSNFLAMIFRNGGKPVYSAGDDLMESLFEKKEVWRPVYDVLAQRIAAEIAGVQFLPKKTYVSITGKREFGVARMMTKEIRVGMDLGDEPFGSYVQQGKGLGAMPRISHMIVVKSEDDITDELLAHLKDANEHVNG
jgi:hypothetical protein